MMLSDVCTVCLLRTSCLSREQRPRKTKIGTEIAHVTGDSDTTFKVKRSTTPGRFTHRHVGASGSCSCGRGNVMAVRNCCYVTVWEALRRPGGGEGWGHIVAPERLQLVYGTLKIEYFTLHYITTLCAAICSWVNTSLRAPLLLCKVCTDSSTPPDDPLHRRYRDLLHPSDTRMLCLGFSPHPNLPDTLHQEHLKKTEKHA